MGGCGWEFGHGGGVGGSVNGSREDLREGGGGGMKFICQFLILNVYITIASVRFVYPTLRYEKK